MEMARLRLIITESALSSVIHFYCFIQFPEFLEMMKTKANEVDQGAELRYIICTANGRWLSEV